MGLTNPTIFISATGNTSGALALISTGTAYLSGGANITLSQNGQTIEISGAAGGGGGATFSGGISTQGNTAGTTGFATNRLLFVGSNQISLSQSVNGGSATLTINATQSVQTQMTGLSAGMSTEGNTLGTTGLVSNRLVLVGGNNITLSQSVNGQSATLTISGPNTAAQTVESQSIGISTITDGGSTAGTSGLASGGQVRYLFVPGSNITMSQSVNGASATLTVHGASGGGGGGGGFTLSYWRNMAAEVINSTATATILNSTSYIQPFVLDATISCSYARFLWSYSCNSGSQATTANATGGAQHQTNYFLMLYTRGTGASSNSLLSYASASASLLQSWTLSANANGSQWTLSQSITHPITGTYSTFTTGVTTSLTNYSMGSLSLTRFTGAQHLDLPFATSLSPGNYWLLFGVSSQFGITTGISGLSSLRLAGSMLNCPQINTNVHEFGQVSNSSIQLQLGVGSLSSNAVGTKSAFDMSLISSSASHPLMPVQFIRIT